MNDQKIVTCAYCGHVYPPGAPTSQHELLTEHIKICDKHPMCEAEETIKTLVALLAEVLCYIPVTSHPAIVARAFLSERGWLK